MLTYFDLLGTVTDPSLSDEVRQSVTLPVFEISDYDSLGIMNLIHQNTTVVIYIGQREPTGWDYWYDWRGYFIAAAGALCGLTSLVYVLYVLSIFIRNGWAFNIASTCILLHLLLSICTLNLKPLGELWLNFGFLVQLIWSFGIVPQRNQLAPYLLTPVVFMGMVPIVDATTMLITLFWFAKTPIHSLPT